MNALQGRAPTWYKPKFLLEIFEQYDPEYILFLDIDAAIVDGTEQIESFIDPLYDLVATRDYGHHSVMNAGVLLIKNTEWSKKLLNLWWHSAEFYTPRMIPELSVSDETRDVSEYFKHGLWHDQTCLTILYKNTNWMQPKTKIIDYRRFNWMNPFDKNFIYHGFCFGNFLYRKLDEVHAKIFNMDAEVLPTSTKKSGKKAKSLAKKNKKHGKSTTSISTEPPIITTNQENAMLSDIAKKYPTDKDFTHNYYNNVYEKYFSPLKESTKLLCEIGIGGFWADAGWVHGNSLKVFRDYFINAQILGLDITHYEIDDLDRITLDWLDQSKKQLVEQYSNRLSNYDIILDDGSHNTYDQQITFAYFFRSLRSGGIYVLEDLHSSIEVKIPEKAQTWGWGDPTKTTALELLEKFNETGKIVSDYLTKEESAYLETNIKSIEIFYLAPTSITSIITKK
jgi:hypothetical protein